MSGVAISQTLMIKIFGGISLVKDNSFSVATGKFSRKRVVHFFHNLHLSGFNFFCENMIIKQTISYIFIFSFLVTIYF